MTSTRLHQKSVKSGLLPPCFNRRLVVVGMRNAVQRELSSAPPRYDAKPGRSALNQGSRKRSSGGVTCPGLIRCAGLDKVHQTFIIKNFNRIVKIKSVVSFQEDVQRVEF